MALPHQSPAMSRLSMARTARRVLGRMSRVSKRAAGAFTRSRAPTKPAVSYVSRCPKDLYSILYLYDSLLWYTGGTKYMGHRGTGTRVRERHHTWITHEAAAIGPIVPISVIGTAPDWLRTKLYLLRCAPQVQYVQVTLLVCSCRA